jgi:hypothetical protein
MSVSGEQREESKRAIGELGEGSELVTGEETEGIEWVTGEQEEGSRKVMSVIERFQNENDYLPIM